MNELEEGTEPRIDFAKLEKIGACEQGVVPVVLQDADSGAVLWVAYANEAALAETLRSGRAVLWSTSRGELWRKGETSGDWLELVDVRVNCEQNSLLYRVRPRGRGVCHTNEPDGTPRATCFYRSLASESDALAFVPPSAPRSSDST